MKFKIGNRNEYRPDLIAQVVYGDHLKGLSIVERVVATSWQDLRRGVVLELPSRSELLRDKLRKYR